MSIAQAQTIADKATFTQSTPMVNGEPTPFWDVALAEPVGGIQSMCIAAESQEDARQTLIEHLLPIN